MDKETQNTLGFLDPRVIELLMRIAEADRREPLQEIAFLIENRATELSGRAIQPLSLEGLPPLIRAEHLDFVSKAPGAANKADAPEKR